MHPSIMAVVNVTQMIDCSITFVNPSVTIEFFADKNPVVQTMYNNGQRNVARASVLVMGTESGYPWISRKIPVQDGHALHHAISTADIKGHYSTNIELILHLREPALFTGIENTTSVILYYESSTRPSIQSVTLPILS
jgi:hypothetical protein